MATREEVERALERVRARFEDPDLRASFRAFTKSLQFTFEDLGTSFILKVVNGEVRSLREGEVESPDIFVTLRSDALVEIMEGRLNPVQAYMRGQLRVKGAMLDLLKLQKLLG